MPGLSAIIELNGAPVAQRLLSICSDAVQHRGREVSSWVQDDTAFAYLDLSEPPEPRLVGDAQQHLVMVGHLYGQDELAQRLEVEIESDPRLILAAYRRWGAECVDQLDGDFSFVLWDATQRRVLCARDALGMHPLCYSVQGERLVVASEPRQIAALSDSVTPGDVAISNYLSAKRHLHGGAETLYDGISRVEPGHSVLVTSDGIRPRCHWKLDPDRRLDETTDEELAAAARELMIDAVRRRAPHEGPYSCALSGGFDSSTVAVLLQRSLRARGIEDTLETFSFELRDPEADEPEIIDAVSNELGTNHHHIYLDQDNVFEVLPSLIAACDEPTFDMGLLYLWRKKERAAQQQVRIVLSGLGGDELFVGQFHYLADLLRQFRLIELWREIGGIYPVDRSKNRRTSLAQILQYYVLGPLVPRSLKQTARRVLLRQPTVPPWVAPALARRSNLEERILAGPEQLYADGYRQDCYEVFKHSLVNITLPLHEALGAAFGIETRFPLLDRRLVEFMFAAPRDQKIRQGEVRILQRSAMADVLPEAVLTRHVKKNINPVLRRQQQENFLVEIERLFAKKELACLEYVDGDYLRSCHQRALGGDLGSEATMPIWFAMNLERWLEGMQRSRSR